MELLTTPLILFVIPTSGNGTVPPSFQPLWTALLHPDLPSDLLESLSCVELSLLPFHPCSNICSLLALHYSDWEIRVGRNINGPGGNYGEDLKRWERLQYVRKEREMIKMNGGESDTLIVT